MLRTAKHHFSQLSLLDAYAAWSISRTQLECSLSAISLDLPRCTWCSEVGVALRFPHHHPQSDQAKLDRRIRRFRSAAARFRLLAFRSEFKLTGSCAAIHGMCVARVLCSSSAMWEIARASCCGDLSALLHEAQHSCGLLSSCRLEELYSVLRLWGGSRARRPPCCMEVHAYC